MISIEIVLILNSMQERRGCAVPTATSPKIIVASMTTKYEASLDVAGEYIAGKSTTIILGRKRTIQIDGNYQ